MPPTLHLPENGQASIYDFYKPYPHQLTLHCAEAHNLLGIGGWGSGKSTFLVGESLAVCEEFAGADVLLLRRDYPELERGLIHDFKEMVPEDLYTYNDQKHIATFDNGSHIFFGHLQESRTSVSQGYGNERALAKYLSSAFVFIGIDEIAQFSYQAFVFLCGRNRVNRACQPNALGNMPMTRIAGATNPMGPGYGWIKRLWIDQKPVTQMGDVFRKPDGKFYQTESTGKEVCVYDPQDFFYTHSTILDNPAQLDKDPEYIQKLERMPPALRQKALYGDLHTIAGTYFQNFSYERNVMSLPRDHELIRFEEWQPRWISMDWGLAHQTSVHWHTKAWVKDPLDNDNWKMRVITYREKQLNDAGYSQLCQAVADMTPDSERPKLRYIFMSPDRFRRSEHDPAHLISDEMTANFRRLGMPSVSRAYDRRADGAVFMYNLIESGDWIILDACPILIRSIETRIRDDKDLEDVLKTDDELDDAFDDARYGLVSMLREKDKPEEVKIKEKIASIPDPTARMLYAFEQMNKRDESKRPIKPKIVPRWQVGR